MDPSLNKNDDGTSLYLPDEKETLDSISVQPEITNQNENLRNNTVHEKLLEDE